MKADIALRWTAELRSGRHDQGFGELDKGEKCCLGVLCWLAVEDGVIPPPTLTPSGARLFGSEGHRATLPAEVQTWAGLKSELGIISTELSLASMNDASLYGDNGEHLYSFSDIADVIEKNVNEL